MGGTAPHARQNRTDVFASNGQDRAILTAAQGNLSQAARVRRAGRFVEQQFYQRVCAQPQQLASS